jgi:predicted Zn finger-like uncharacterized protein
MKGPDMTISLTCPDCSKNYQIRDDFAGKRVKCKACGSVFQVTAPVSALSPNDFLRELSEQARQEDFVSSDEVNHEDFQFARVGAVEQSEALIDPEPSSRPSSRREQTRPSAPDSPEDDGNGDSDQDSIFNDRAAFGFGSLHKLSNEVNKLPQLQQSRPGKISGFNAFLKRASYAVGLIFREKELIVFALLQWVAVIAVYFLWVEAMSWLPESAWVRESDEVTSTDIIVGIWSALCIALATFPIAICSGCMGAVHFLHKQGQRSTIASCLRIVMPHSGRLWAFQFVDGFITVQQILNRLPKKDDNRSSAEKALSEALYYAWKLGSIGILPSLIFGKTLFDSAKTSFQLVKKRFADVALLRTGYSLICWIVGILTYVGGVAFIIKSGQLDFNADSGSQMTTFLMLIGVPLLVSVGVIQMLIRPVFIISLCDIYSRYLEDEGESPELPESPGRGVEVLVAFTILALIIAGILIFPRHLGILELLQTD